MGRVNGNPKWIMILLHSHGRLHHANLLVHCNYLQTKYKFLFPSLKDTKDVKWENQKVVAKGVGI